MLTLYDFEGSGNGYKVSLLLNLLGRPYNRVEVNILKGESRTETYLKEINPVGKIPAVLLEDGRRLIESNAIITFLAEGTDFIPSDPYLRNQMLSWQFWEQNRHEVSLAEVRFWRHFKKVTPEFEPMILLKEKQGYECLDLMEQQLLQTDWLVGDRISLADISLYPYTHVSPEGHFDLDRYPAIRAWFARIEALEGYQPMSYAPDQSQRAD